MTGQPTVRNESLVLYELGVDEVFRSRRDVVLDSSLGLLSPPRTPQPRHRRPRPNH